jgi:hypothetical protein
VLEQVREAGAPDGLVLRADAIPEVHRREREPVVLVENHREPVVEPILLEGDGDLLSLSNGHHGDAGHGELAGKFHEVWARELNGLRGEEDTDRANRVKLGSKGPRRLC